MDEIKKDSVTDEIFSVSDDLKEVVQSNQEKKDAKGEVQETSPEKQDRRIMKKYG